jgi:hypothetical protein
VLRALTPALAAAALALAGCGGATPADRAESAASIAAEGALLAHEVAEGSTTGAFTRSHARALKRKVEPLAEEPRLGAIARRIAAELDRLAADPGDEEAAAAVERALERAGERAERLAR